LLCLEEQWKTMDSIKANTLIKQEFFPTFNKSWGSYLFIYLFIYRTNLHINWFSNTHIGFTLCDLWFFFFQMSFDIHLLQDRHVYVDDE